MELPKFPRISENIYIIFKYSNIPIIPYLSPTIINCNRCVILAKVRISKIDMQKESMNQCSLSLCLSLSAVLHTSYLSSDLCVGETSYWRQQRTVSFKTKNDKPNMTNANKNHWCDSKVGEPSVFISMLNNNETSHPRPHTQYSNVML